MLKARHGEEIVVRTSDKIGALAALSKIIAEKGVSILAMSAWVEDGEGVVRLVTDDNLRTSDVLHEKGYVPQKQDVVLVDAAHKPGILRHLAEALSREGIDISHLFASATINQDECLVVLNTADNGRAIVLLNG